MHFFRMRKEVVVVNTKVYACGFAFKIWRLNVVKKLHRFLIGEFFFSNSTNEFNFATSHVSGCTVVHDYLFIC